MIFEKNCRNSGTPTPNPVESSTLIPGCGIWAFLGFPMGFPDFGGFQYFTVIWIKISYTQSSVRVKTLSPGTVCLGKSKLGFLYICTSGVLYLFTGASYGKTDWKK